MAIALTNLNVPSIKISDAEAAPAAAAVAALIASVAAGDGVLTPQKFAAGLGVADAVAGLTDDPAVLKSLILRALNATPQPLDAVLTELTNRRAELPEPARRPLLEALFPLLSTQGDQARPIARRIAAALALSNTAALLDNALLPPETGGMTTLLKRVVSPFGRGKGRVELAADVAQFTGDEALAKLIEGDRRERDAHLNVALAAAFEQLRGSVATLTEAQDRYNGQLEIAQSLDRTADELERQFKAQLHNVSRRIEVLRRHVAEDIESLYENGGEEAEVDLRRMSEKRGLLKRHDDRDTRERLIAKSLARRHTELKRRYDEQVQLLRDELAQFRDEYVEAVQSAVKHVSLADWRLAVPGMTTGARVKDALDQGATHTLAGGAVAAAGAAGAVGAGWLAPAAVAGAVAAPVGLAVLGVVAAAGVWKLYANREDRLRTEQRERAEAIRKTARSKVEEAFAEVSIALDEIAEGFREASLSRIRPIRHDAERIREMCALQGELVRRISNGAQERLRRWQQDLQEH